MNIESKRKQVKPSSTLKSCVVKVLATAVLLGSLLPTYGAHVYAEPDNNGDAGKQQNVGNEVKKDDDKDGTKTPEGKGNNNVFDTANQSYVEPFKKATGYKLGMQYAVTYNILSSQYGDGSKYSGLFRGDKSSVSGSWSETFALPQGNSDLAVSKFGGKNLYDEVTSGGARDGSFEEHDKNQDTGNDKSKELEKLAEPLADKMAERYASVINYYLGASESYMTQASEIDGWGWTSDQRGMKVKWYDMGSRGSNHAEGKYEKKLKEVIKPKLVEDLKNITKKEDIVKPNGAGLTLEKVVGGKGYIEAFREKNTDKSVKKGYKGLGGQGWYNPRDKRYLYTVEVGDMSKEKTKSEIDSYVRFISEPTHGTTQGANYRADLGKKFTEASQEAYDRLNKSDLDKYLKVLAEKAKDGDKFKEQTGDYSVMGWMPLVVGYQKTDITESNGEAWYDASGGYLKAIEKFDGSKLSGTSLQTKSGSPRAVRLYDLYANKKISPVFIYNTEKYKNKAVSVQAGKAGRFSDSSPGEYIGAKGSSEFNLTWNVIDMVSNAEKPTFEVAKPEKGNWYGEGLMKAITANPGEIKNLKTESDDTVGIDNYGNVIVGNTGAVLIPYWQNYLFLGKLGDKSSSYVSSPIYNNKGASKIKDALKDYLGEAGGFSSLEKKANVDKVDASLRDKVKAVQSALPDGGQISFEKMNEFMQGKTLDNNQDTIRALAMLITADTSDAVKSWNGKFMEDAEKSKELYMDLGTGGFNTSGTSSDGTADKNKWDAASLIQRIGMLLDIGFYELIRLTLASWVVSLYNSSFIGYSINAIFHTSTIADTAMWGDIMGSISLLLIGFMSVYMIFMAFKVFRRTMTAKDFAKQFVLVTLIILIPAMVYSPLIKYVINEPANVVIGKQLRQTSLLDTWLAMETKERKRDEMYVKLFGGTDQLRDRSQDYIVYFYTTKHRHGFDIDTVKDEELTLKDKLSKQVVNDGGTWNKKDLVKVGISIFDLFDWAEARYNKKTEDKLFNWVETNKNKKGEYNGVGGYTEYHIDTSSKFGKQAETNGIKNAKGIDITASELYLRIVNNTKDKGVLDSLNGLYKVASALRDPVQGSPITEEEREALLRDLSMTKASRHAAYGMEGNPFSPKAEKLMNENGINKSEEDMLGIGSLVNELAPYRDMQTTTLDRDIYNVNRELLNDYMTTYSIVRDNMNNPAGSFKDAEIRMITLSEFFKVNGALDLHGFPRNYEGQTISFDSYVRMAFVPMYFFDLENQDIDNVAQYLSLRENPLVLFVFLVALFALLVFGMTYLVVFYFGMMLVMVIAFVKNYVIRFNRDNKSWLGALVIIGTFGLAKLGLLSLWYAMTYFMNYSTAKAEGLTYPYTLIHSLIISVYIFIVMKFVFMKLFKAVIKDKGNLGGEIFSNGINRMAGNLRGRFGGATRGVSHGAMRAAGGLGSAIKRTLGREGAAGKLAGAGLSKLGGKSLGLGKRLGRRTAGALFGKSLSKMNIVGARDTIVKKLQDAGSNLKTGFNDSKAGRLLKYMTGADGGAFTAVMQDYYNIDENESDVSGGKQKEAGVIASGGASYTTVALDTVEQAQKMVDYLQSQGVKAVQDMSTVSFDTTGLNLQKAGVRKGLFKGLLDRTVDELENLPKPKDVYGLTSLNYSTYTDDNGRKIDGYKVDLGQDGLSNESFSNLVNSQYFQDNFKVLKVPQRDAQGNYLPGTAELEYIGKRNGKKAMKKLFKEDARIREENGVEERKTSKLSTGLEVGEGSQDLLNEIDNLLVQGMKRQNGRILYDNRNKYHRKAVEEIRDTALSGFNEIRENNVDMAQKLSAYVVDGDNHGFNTGHFSTQSEGSDAMFERLGVEADTHFDKVFTGAGNSAAENKEVLEGLLSLINLDGQDIGEFARAKAELTQRANERILTDESGAADYAKGVASLTTYATKVGLQGDFTSLEDEYVQLNEARENNTVSDDTYNRKAKEIFESMQSVMETTGHLEGFASDKLGSSVSSNDRDALTKFRGVKEHLVTDKQVDADMLTKVDISRLGELESILGQIKDIKANQDGVLTILSRGNGVSQKGIENILRRYGNIS